MNKGTEVLLRLFVAQTLLDESGLPARDKDTIFHRVYEAMFHFSQVGEPESPGMSGDELRHAEQSPVYLPFDLGGNLSVHQR